MEIGATQIRVGAIAAVKVLGLLGLIDDGEVSPTKAEPSHSPGRSLDLQLHLWGALTPACLLCLFVCLQTDWKVIAISISDPMAHQLNDVDDVEIHLPGAIKAIREYFRYTAHAHTSTHPGSTPKGHG